MSIKLGKKIKDLQRFSWVNFCTLGCAFNLISYIIDLILKMRKKLEPLKTPDTVL